MVKTLPAPLCSDTPRTVAQAVRSNQLRTAASAGTAGLGRKLQGNSPKELRDMCDDCLATTANSQGQESIFSQISIFDEYLKPVWLCQKTYLTNHF